MQPKERYECAMMRGHSSGRLFVSNFAFSAFVSNTVTIKHARSQEMLCIWQLAEPHNPIVLGPTLQRFQNLSARLCCGHSPSDLVTQVRHTRLQGSDELMGLFSVGVRLVESRLRSSPQPLLLR